MAKKYILSLGSALLIGVVIFGTGTVLLALLLWQTPLPEQGIEWFGTGILSFGCLVSGALSGRYTGKQGLLWGIGSAGLLAVLVTLGVAWISGSTSMFDGFSIRNLIGLAAGGAGGIFGVNLSDER